MQKVRASCDDIVVKVSSLLNDQLAGHEFEHWPKEDVECAYLEAISTVSLVRPDLAVGLVSVELSEGSLQRVPDGCLELYKVVGVEDENGNVQDVATKASNKLSKWFPDACSTSAEDGQYRLTSYDTDDTNSRIFYVQPPVPKGFSGKILLQCASACKEVDIDCRYEAPITEFMLYRLLITETDSVTSSAAAEVHFSRFATLLGLSYQMKQRLRKGEDDVVTPQQN